jgi:hypothetical protein
MLAPAERLLAGRACMPAAGPARHWLTLLAGSGCLLAARYWRRVDGGALMAAR